jgi:hypothetical protein
MKLFRLENYEIKLNKDEALLIPEFAALFTLKYNKKTAGDVDGRKRVRAFKELTYLYFMIDYKSEHVNYTNEERHVKSLEDSGLEENYTISKELRDAMQRYDQMQQTLSLKALSSLRQTLITSMEMAETIEMLMQEELINIKKGGKKLITEDGVDISIEEQRSSNLDAIGVIVSLIQKTGAIAASIPKTITTLENLEDKVKSENQSIGTKTRGDQEGGWLGG